MQQSYALKRNKMLTFIKLKQYWFLYLLFVPSALYYVSFQIYPIVIQLVLSFKNYRILGGIWGSPWVGFDNFHAIFSNDEFYTALRNTVIISLLRLAFGFFPPILLAIFLFDLRSNLLRRISQTILYIPHFFSMVIVYGVVFAMFSNLGFINHLIEAMGGNTINFLMSPGWFRPLLVGSGIWKEIGWGTIIYLAGLSAVNPALYEAAKIDGAGPWSRIWHITLPELRPLIIFLLTLSIGNVLYAGFEQIVLFYNPATYSVGDVVDTWVYRQGLQQLQYSLASAAQMFQSFFGLILILFANKLSRKYVGYGIW
ncbi:ABC transporter permease [Cohnella soli]|uniref:ABC transporter permease n=1 Tax=Cohnella soli TaxID=425005 RepID=A0ABW0HLK2_9BACL